MNNQLHQLIIELKRKQPAYKPQKRPSEQVLQVISDHHFHVLLLISSYIPSKASMHMHATI